MWHVADAVGGGGGGIVVVANGGGDFIIVVIVVVGDGGVHTKKSPGRSVKYGFVGTNTEEVYTRIKIMLRT